VFLADTAFLFMVLLCLLGNSNSLEDDNNFTGAFVFADFTIFTVSSVLCYQHDCGQSLRMKDQSFP
jgi:hypothetical protein